MKGLELSRSFFRQEALPRLEREAPEALPYLAAGLVGEGSECFGYDDELSRDHDWGAGFCLWLPERLMPRFAGPVRAVLAELPGSHLGAKTRDMTGGGRLGLRSIESFFASLTGYPGVPGEPEQWLAAPEAGLAAAVNGEVFMDGAGEFSAVRAGLLAHYPEDVRRWLLARRCALAAQTGQYNYARCLRHGETLAAEVAKLRFVENAAGAIFMLERRYMPFYKWSYRALRQLSPAGRESAELMESVANAKGAQAAEAIEGLSALIIGLLREQGLSDSGSDFLMDHCGGIMGRIGDEKLRRKGISLIF